MIFGGYWTVKFTSDRYHKNSLNTHKSLVKKISRTTNHMQAKPTTRNQAQPDFDVIIVGAGFSGLLCASYLTEAGITNIRLYDMSPSVGGVWSHGGVGAYPGAACDVPAYVYLPFLDRTGYIPSKKYVGQIEIANYAEMLTDQSGIRDKIRFLRKVTEIKYLGDGNCTWQVTTLDAITGYFLLLLGQVIYILTLLLITGPFLNISHFTPFLRGISSTH